MDVDGGPFYCCNFVHSVIAYNIPFVYTICVAGFIAALCKINDARAEPEWSSKTDCIFPFLHFLFSLY